MFGLGTFEAVILIIIIVPGMIGAYLAHTKGRNRPSWFLLSAIMPLFIILLIFLPPVREIKGRHRQCPACKEFIKWDAAICKHCGTSLTQVVQKGKSNTSQPIQKNIAQIIFAVVFALLIIGIISRISIEDKAVPKNTFKKPSSLITHKKPSFKSKLSNEIYYLKEYHAGSESALWLSKFYKYLELNDFQAALEMGKSGKIFELEADTPVYIESKNTLTGFIEVRPRGKTKTFYTTPNALSLKPIEEFPVFY